MTHEVDDLHSIAARNLQALGLSEYAARTLLALTRIGGGSARDVSDASSVPRTRVYDAVNELADRGFVRVHECHPKKFTPASPQRIRRAFYREFLFRLAIAEWGLLALEPDDDQSEGVDVEMGAEAVARRSLATIADAEKHLTYVSVGETPPAEVVAMLDDATVRGVDVTVLYVGAGDPTSISDAVPAATVVTAPNAATPPNGPSHILLVDESLALLGTWDSGSVEETEVGFISERSGSGVTTLLHQVVDSWLADAAETKDTN